MPPGGREDTKSGGDEDELGKRLITKECGKKENRERGRKYECDRKKVRDYN